VNQAPHLRLDDLKGFTVRQAPHLRLDNLKGTIGSHAPHLHLDDFDGAVVGLAHLRLPLQHSEPAEHQDHDESQPYPRYPHYPPYPAPGLFDLKLVKLVSGCSLRWRRIVQSQERWRDRAHRGRWFNWLGRFVEIQKARTGAALVDADVDKIAFTGSTEVGKLLMRQAASTVKKVALELGGNAPFIVCRDADLDDAVRGALVAKFRHSAQVCIAANRFFVHEDRAEEFTDGLAEQSAGLCVGNGMDPGSQMGPLISDEQFEKVLGFLVANAKITEVEKLTQQGTPLPDAPAHGEEGHVHGPDCDH